MLRSLLVLQRSWVGLHAGDGSPMLISKRGGVLLLVSLLCTAPISAGQYRAPTFPGDGKIHLDVVVSPKSGPPVSGLQQQDFTILDNKVPQTITSFEAVDGRQAPLEVVLLIDAVNLGFREVAVARDGINKFLKADGGRLSQTTTFAILTDKGIYFHEEFSKDGNALSTALEHYTIPLRSINNATDHGEGERSQLTLLGLGQLVTREGPRPGRKIIVWVAPAGLLILGSKNMLDSKIEQQVFGNIVDTSTQLLEAQITLYSVDPLGTAEVGASYWKAYLKGVSKPSQVQMGDLALGVIATQSGGLALNSSNDIVVQLQECIADAGTYYEISFDPPMSDGPNEYHQLEVHVAKPGLTARTRQGYYTQPESGAELTVESEKPGGMGDDALSLEPGARSVTPEAFSQQVYYANAHPYLDLSLAQLAERIPELRALQPAANRQELSVILQKVGRSVDDFVREIGDLIAHEDVTQERLTEKGGVRAKQRVQDNYLILHHGYEWGASAEYRMDEKGNRLGPIGLEKRYLVTSGFALSCISFSTVAQSQSRLRYLGEEKIGSRETYVLGFAQKPGEATFLVTMIGTEGAVANMLTQGILWVDKNNFQIIRMRSDLLAPQNEIGLDQLTTEVTFGEVQLQDVPNPLWLPSDVDVSMEIKKQKFHNVHHYTNYRRYRVSVKIGAPQ
jgi:VWFA-related protein